MARMVIVTDHRTGFPFAFNPQHVTGLFKVEQMNVDGVTSMTHILLVNGQMVPVKEQIENICEMIGDNAA